MAKKLEISKEWNNSMPTAIISANNNFSASWNKDSKRYDIYLNSGDKLRKICDYGFSKRAQKYHIHLCKAITHEIVTPVMLGELSALCRRLYKQFPKLKTVEDAAN